MKFNTKLRRTARCVFGSQGRQHGQQLRGFKRGVLKGGGGCTECSSVVLALVERTQSRIFIKIESSMSRGQHRRRRRRRRLRQTVSSMRKDSSRQDKEAGDKEETQGRPIVCYTPNERTVPYINQSTTPAPIQLKSAVATLRQSNSDCDDDDGGDGDYDDDGSSSRSQASHTTFASLRISYRHRDFQRVRN